jgi:hypothetical protein
MASSALVGEASARCAELKDAESLKYPLPTLSTVSTTPLYMHMHTRSHALTQPGPGLNALGQFLGHTQRGSSALRANLQRWQWCQARGIE